MILKNFIQFSSNSLLLLWNETLSVFKAVSRLIESFVWHLLVPNRIFIGMLRDLQFWRQESYLALVIKILVIFSEQFLN